MGRKIILNTHLIAYLLLLALYVGLGVYFLSDKEIGNIVLSVICFVLAALPIVSIIISPAVFVFDDDKLTIVYFLSLTEVIYWSEIRSVVKRGGSLLGQTGKGLPEYEIIYPHRPSTPFFIDSCIIRNKKTAKLLKRYCKKNIRDY